MKKTPDYILRARQTHHDALSSLYADLHPGTWEDGLALWRKLRRVEARANQSACAYCNGEIDSEQWEAEKDKITARVKDIFGGTLPPGFFVNGDPRGYSLKMEENSTKHALHQDFGHYQILAPEIND